MIKWIPQTDQREILPFESPDFPGYKDLAAISVKNTINITAGNSQGFFGSLYVTTVKSIFVVQINIAFVATDLVTNVWVNDCVSFFICDVPDRGNPGLLVASALRTAPYLICKSGETNAIDIMRTVPGDVNFSVISGTAELAAIKANNVQCVVNVSMFYLLLN